MTAVPLSATAATATEDVQMIVPPPNPTILYLGAVLDAEGNLELSYNDQQGDRLLLVYSDKWKDEPTTLVLQLPKGWSLSPVDENISWTGSPPMWIGQIVTPSIKDVVDGTKPSMSSHFTLYHAASKRSQDPVVIIHKEG
jgi:hypothetical protein